jgi:hypothetical protein
MGRQRNRHSQKGCIWLRRIRSGPMPYVVVLCFDSACVCPLILRDDSEPLLGGDGLRYRLVTETGDYAEAVRVADELGWRIKDRAAHKPQ